ncbi:hypothetical protein BN59_03243 [Legionella massiliensis]|uniref:DUF4239 domain-containing protein n=1 Tax=Legionella massiliensis TaxID=1034943 RepID=A0A078L4V5_9GAMM|nr:DUF4239 domain-containing protein [Legionella massiliensis]CDZ78928.1 hypothetical protein BN59_03243 [Legionella massiliensis]CEE14666.1 hypothetical protein BN1094_03243 [Legionella massiliensis]
MAREMINIIPFWCLIILTMLILTLVGYCSARISSYFFSRRVGDDQRKLANTLIGILSGGFSILLAFVIINSWNYQLSARLLTSQEADYLSILLHNITVFPKDEQETLRSAIRDYVVAVRTDEWQAMKGGQDSPKAWDAIDKLYTVVQAYNPQESQEKIYYVRLIANLNELLQSRRERLNGVTSIIPGHLRMALILGSILLIVVLGAMRGEATIFYIMPLMFFSVVLGFNLALALSFDYPYSGDISVSNKPFYRGVLGELSDTP